MTTSFTKSLVAVAASLASLVSAQPMTTSWYESAAQCTTNSAASVAIPAYRVRGPRALCLNVPANPTSYISYCNAAGTGGVMAMCTDGACGVCGAANMPFTNGACLTVPAGVTPVGAFPRVAVNCSALAGSELQVPLEGTSVFVTYHADPDCMVGPANYRTEFLTQSGRCNPVSATASVSFDCVGDTGVYKQYTTAGDCTGASLDTPFFASGQCLPQPEGEPALSVMCAQPPSPSPTPSPTPSQTPSGAARSPSASPTASASSIAVVDAQSGSGGLEAGVASVIAAVVGTVAMMAGAWMV